VKEPRLIKLWHFSFLLVVVAEEAGVVDAGEEGDGVAIKTQQSALSYRIYDIIQLDVICFIIF